MVSTSRRALLLGSVGAAASAAIACHPPPAEAPPPPAAEPAGSHLEPRRLPLPPRASTSMTGSSLIETAMGLRAAERERLLVKELVGGNLPDFERRLVPVDLAEGALRGRVWVLPDYLSIGSDRDWVRVPLTVRSAKEVARASSSVLPTRRLVDAIQLAATLRLSSPYMPPGRDMASVEYFAAHHAAIEDRRQRAGGRLGDLVAGPKKDLVLSRRSQSEPGRTPIYGWFTDDGRAIQGLSLLHDDRYVDYAHGVRLVLRTMEVDGREADVLDVLADPERAALISDEGAFDMREAWARGW